MKLFWAFSKRRVYFLFEGLKTAVPLFTMDLTYARSRIQGSLLFSALKRLQMGSSLFGTNGL